MATQGKIRDLKGKKHSMRYCDLEDGGSHVQGREQPLEVELTPSQWPARKQLNSAINLNELENGFFQGVPWWSSG